MAELIDLLNIYKLIINFYDHLMLEWSEEKSIRLGLMRS